MRKLYSLVLMATALLIGTNVWAGDNWLQDQFDAVPADGQTHTITMGEDIILQEPVYLGTATVDEARKSIILDMNGHSITMDASAWVANAKLGTAKGDTIFCSMFTITHGELLVRNSDKTKTSLIQMTGTGYDKYNNIFNVAGSYKSSRWVKSGNDYVISESAAKNTRKEGWFTHLEIGEGVKLVAGNEIYGAAISMDGYYTNYHALVSSASKPQSGKTPTGVFGNTGLKGAAKNVCLYNRSDAPTYNTTLLSKSAGEGVAYGLRVDVYGDIEFASDAEAGKTYGIKINGGIKSSLKEKEIFLNTYCWPMDQAYAKTYADAAAPVAKTKTTPEQNQTYTIEGTYYTNHILDTIDAPFLYVHSTAHIVTAAEAEEATAVYCSGYGKTLIEGECKGKSGVNIKSGTVELHDAVIESTATTYTETEGGNHATGTGGVIVNSVNGRAGGIEVVISGDTKVSTTKGYAIEEVVNKTDDTGTEVSSIKIQGGTIEGGDKGAIAISSETKEDESAAVSVTGGNVQGGATVGKQTVDISTLFPNTQQYHTTEVTVNGKPTVIVSEGPAPSAQNTGNWETISAKTGQNVVWNEIEDASIGENKTVTLGELQIIPASAGQTLTIANKATLKVNHLIMNDYARIIVEAGGKLIVEGEQGIVAPKVDNIVLESSESKQAYFLFNPGVTSNRHPNATVELYTNCKQLSESPWTYTYQRFALPIIEGATPENDFSGSLFGSETVFENYVWEWNGSSWVVAPTWASLNPFKGYQLANNSSAGGVTYKFKGQLVGNGNANYEFPTGGYDAFGSSHMAPIYIDSLLKPYETSNMEATVWVYDYSTSNFKAVTSENIKEFPTLFKDEIKPMDAFVLRIHASSGSSTMSYASAIWGNPNFDAAIGRASQKNPAPARVRTNASNRAIISIVAENGYSDQVTLVEKDKFSAEFDNGADASKYMYENGINLYAVTEAGDLSSVATDNLAGTMLSFRAGNDTQYTINFTNVLGKDYALRDNVTGQVITLKEGASYSFMQEANSTVPARFEIVGRQNMPTAIDNVEEAAKATGIYTITGQYLGRDFSNLPAGVYIVNGVKVVK